MLTSILVHTSDLDPMILMLELDLDNVMVHLNTIKFPAQSDSEVLRKHTHTDATGIITYFRLQLYILFYRL